MLGPVYKYNIPYKMASKDVQKKSSNGGGKKSEQ